VSRNKLFHGESSESDSTIGNKQEPDSSFGRDASDPLMDPKSQGLEKLREKIGFILNREK
jgi:hypothetical protein